LSKLHLVLLVHAHQPVGNFDEVIERAYERSYLPLLEHLARHARVRAGLHYSGSLLEWIEQRHPEYFERLRELQERGQVELLGGGFYEPILVAIPPEDQLEQLRRMADYLAGKLGRRPSGAWLAERIWEPQLPAMLAQAGVEYTLVDDTHFIASGFEASQLYGYYVVEERGRAVKVIPGLKALRYLIPFRPVDETIEFLRGVAGARPGGLAGMGDDCEKFGVWPGTYNHCYRDGWLERFFAALEANSEWLVTTPPGEYVAATPPLGRAELPTAAYAEMMEWALPTGARQRFRALQEEFASRPDVQRFLRGGFWRSFLTKYAEANLLHKKMLYVSGQLHGLESRRRAPGLAKKLAEATTHLLRAQCNDAYWHGIFGGLYAPHLRTELWRELVRAEKLADAVGTSNARSVRVRKLDFDADGAEEIYVTSPRFAALLKPSDGGTLAALDLRPGDVTLINSIQRRPEPYHARLREVARSEARQVASIHEQQRVKEEGLERHLRYDRWPRHAFRLLLFPRGKSYADYEALRLEESPEFAAGAYKVVEASAKRLELEREGRFFPRAPDRSRELCLRVSKTLSFAQSAEGFDVSCRIQLAHQGSGPLSVQMGIEIIVNLLAPNEPDRYFESAGARHPLNWAARVAASELRLVDEWQQVAVALEAPQVSEFWIAPIETVSESEDGFERVYQGSQILAVWPAEPGAEEPWTAEVILRVTPAR
jgi:4-alpha-glucanotransferase